MGDVWWIISMLLTAPAPAEIERVMEMLKHFAAYNRAVAQRGELSAKDGRKMGPKGLGADEHAQDKQAAGVRSRRHSSEALAPHHAHSQVRIFLVFLSHYE
jgi:hypothetical protein